MSKKLGFGILLCFAGLTVMAASPADQERLAAANNGFAFDLLKQIAREQPDTNVFISPFSVSTALQMTGNGAAGETKAEMQRVLKTAGLPAGTLNSACKDLNQSLNSQPGVVLNLANAIWYKKDFHLKTEFVSVNKQFFQAELGGVDFTKPESARTINHWADTSTRGKIKEVVRWPFPSLTRVILANAIYFKGTWDRPFDKNETKPNVFHLSAGGEKQAPTMLQHGDFSCQEGDGFQAVRLPYADDSFDGAIASGVLEHVPMDYESLKELHRVIKPGGRLILTYLPNLASVEEWRLRRRGRNDSHRRLYSPSHLRALLTHSGFWPLVIAHQTQLDALPADHKSIRWLRPVARAAQLHRLTSCLCAVAEKTTYF